MSASGVVASGVVAVAGEALVDIVPAPVAGYHELAPGGSPANTAVGLARLGVPVRMLARLADDLLGRRLRAHLERNEVDLGHVVAAAEPSSMAVVEVDGRGVASYDFRVDGTADWQWTPAELADALDGSVVALHTGSLALTTAPGGAVLRDLVRRAAPTTTISYDPNCRPLLMGTPADVLAVVHEVLEVADVVKVSSEDADWLLPGTPYEAVVDDWIARGAAVVAVTLGADGVLAGTAGGVRTRLPGRPVDVVDTVGAGDTFSAGLLAGLHGRGLLGASAREALRAIGSADFDAVLDGAVRAAAITCSRRGADPPTAAELAASLVPGS
ncbi:carbohydrate kinase [Pseudonocardia sp. N23]|uniref:carbohydrate kinase family protein n=1 Tax=Pseudonocardia sp. N23 TaxID=1987376 RepID=UPI000BFE47C8|nr:carbohydrate kinase [Pseudonocardia sp. N23]GAY09780.1 fructokinase [Pseudonocardia sp. N23]